MYVCGEIPSSKLWRLGSDKSTSSLYFFFWLTFGTNPTGLTSMKGAMFGEIEARSLPACMSDAVWPRTMSELANDDE